MKKLTAALLVFLMMVMTGAMALAYTEGTYTATAQGNNGPGDRLCDVQRGRDHRRDRR